MDYQEFIRAKQSRIRNVGFQPWDAHEMLFPFQADIVKWSIRKGKAAIWAGTGLGKTFMQLSWAQQVARHSGKPVLILAPLAVSAQTIEEAKKIDIAVSRYGSGQIQIANYEQLHNIDCSAFAGVVLDECFPWDTPIECFNIDNSLALKYIKDIIPGDKILNAQGEDHVKEVYKRKVNRAIQICINGRKITCSENHPFFTVHGWRSAQDLQPGDYLLATRAAMRLVRDNIQAEICSEQACQVLREILLSEMEDVPPGTQKKGTYGRNTCENWPEGINMETIIESKGRKGNATNSKPESYEKSSNESKGFCHITKNETQAFRAWGQWSGDDIASAINDGCIVRELGCGMRYITGKTETRFSDMLQSRLGKSRLKNSNRSGRCVTFFKKGSGQKERQDAGFIRVESVEVLEQGHPELEKYRDDTGVVYFYDIKAKRHPSFSVNGLLVHNSSILKNFAGKFRNQIIDAFYNTPFKLCCSATPSPNDYTEIGNHAEFLNVCSRSEMMATYFVHDSGSTQKWRLKGHAEKEFFKWLSTWAVMINKPSDIGYENAGFDLPPLIYHQHTVKSDIQDGYLFQQYASTLSERRDARRESITDRCMLAASLSKGSDEPWLYWCDLNQESELLSDLTGNSVEVKGADKNEVKEERLIGFSRGKYQKLITKPKIAQFGMNWQHCGNMVFVGLSDSFEALYQAVRRCWRFGRKGPVNVHIVISEKEGSVLENIKRKERIAENMQQKMVEHMADLSKTEINNTSKNTIKYESKKSMEVPEWLLINKLAKTG
jgi:hypothetical protein